MNRSFFVEAPPLPRNEFEFFLQSNSQNTMACNAHIHNAIELLYVQEGSYSVSLNGETHSIGVGDLILICSGTIHYVVTGNESRNSYYVVKVPPSFLISLSEREAGASYAMRFALHRTESKCLWRKNELEGSEIQKILEKLILEDKHRGYAVDVSIRLKVIELLLAILRDEGAVASPVDNRAAELIYNVMSYVQTHYAEDIDERELAASHGMSYSYFSRSFKRITGLTFKNYLNRTRISKAEQYLFRNGGSISEAATACGYNSISYFISVYRTVTGKTPYRALKDTKINSK